MMNKKDRLSTLLFVIFCALSCYSLGTAMMDYFLVYPSRFLVGEKEFHAYHELLESAILPVSVFPFLVIIILNACLLFFGPYRASKTLLIISFVCLILDFISTVFFQAPWNLQLSAGKNIELMQRITDTNWIRVFLEVTQGIIVVIMLNQGYSKVSNPASANDSRA